MKIQKILTSVTLGVFVASSLVALPAAPSEAASNINKQSEVKEMFDRLNNYRIKKGVPKVKYNTNVEKVARDWTVKMADSRSLEHNPNYHNDSRIPDDWSGAGEIVAYNGTGSPEQFINQWINSSGHESIMSDDFYTHVGIGIAKSSNGNSYSTINFFSYENNPAGTQSSPTVDKPKPTPPKPAAPKYSVKGDILKKYNQKGVKDKLGTPIRNQVATKGGWTQSFKNGAIYSKKGVATTVQYNGGIRNHYKAMGWQTGKLGFPTSDEKKINGGYYQSFQNGSIHWSKKTGAHTTIKNSPIQKKWKALKYEKGYLGFPSSNQVNFKYKKNANYQNFNGGMVIHSKNTDAHTLKGAVRSRWKANGWERSKLGLPKSDEKKIKGGTYQKFEKGSIHYSKKTGAHMTLGAIQKEWGKKKYERGKLGYPKSEEFKWNGKTRQNFEGGYITYTKKQGVKTHYYKK